MAAAKYYWDLSESSREEEINKFRIFNMHFEFILPSGGVMPTGLDRPRWKNDAGDDSQKTVLNPPCSFTECRLFNSFKYLHHERNRREKKEEQASIYG